MFDCLASQLSENENILNKKNEEKKSGLNVSPFLCVVFFSFFLSDNTSMIVIQQSRSIMN